MRQVEATPIAAHVFISHASSDTAIAQEIADRLGNENAWIDCWNLDEGGMLPQNIAEAIHQSKWFVLIASAKAMASRWVRYELNLALVHWIQEADCRIVVLHIDDCEVHPELVPFVRSKLHDVNSAIDDLAQHIISNEQSALKQPAHRRRRGIVDRYEELGAIERLLHEDVSLVFVCGMYGIGKTTLLDRLGPEVTGASVFRIALTQGHGPLRLAMEFAVRNHGPMPDPASSEQELIGQIVHGIVNLCESGVMLLLDDAENLMTDDGEFRSGLISIFQRLCEHAPLRLPVFVASSRVPEIRDDPALHEHAHIMRLGPLKDADMINCVENWLSLSQPAGKMPKREVLKRLVVHLFGYPLAARVAAYYIARYSAETLSNELSHFKDLRIDIAKQLLGRIRVHLSEVELNCLDVLSVIDTGATIEELARAVPDEPAVITRAINRLAATLIIFPEEGRIQLHPIVKDFFWRRAFASGKWSDYAHRAALDAKDCAAQAKPASDEFIYYSSKAYRMFMLSGRSEDAYALGDGFKEIIREVAKDMYHLEQTETALRYAQTWLQCDPADYEIQWYAARCLTRLDSLKAAEDILQKLLEKPFPRYYVYQAMAAIRRKQNHLEQAEVLLRRALDERPKHVPSLRDLSEVLNKMGDLDGAVETIERAYDLMPRDPTVLALYADVLESSGRLSTALEVLEGAIATYPEDLGFRLQLSRILEKIGRFNDSLNEARRAAEGGHSFKRFIEATLQFASLQVRTGDLNSAETALGHLPSKLPSVSLRMLRERIAADIKLRRGDITSARAMVSPLLPARDAATAELAVRIEIEETVRAISRKRKLAAIDRLRRGDELLRAALASFPRDPDLLEVEQKLRSLKVELDIASLAANT